mmetsp:Transcript_1484/g.4383  ORF Transcript_1484/g.4383 Transcript_1484/m.4383 type:complete len:364 (-) Transcript_1484:1660-2751(-)
MIAMRLTRWLCLAALLATHRALCPSSSSSPPRRVATPRRAHDVAFSEPRQQTDVLRRALTRDGFVSVKAVDCTAMVREASDRHECGRVAATALGRALAGVVLIADGIDDEETFQVWFDGDGPLGGLLAVANGKLQARGYVGNAKYDDPRGVEAGVVGAAIGKGLLKVVRLKNLPGEDVASPFSSIVEIVSGEIAEDLHHFVATSEQREGAMAAGVAVDPFSNRTSVQAAGGWRIDVLPDAPTSIVSRLIGNVDDLLAQKISTTDYLLGHDGKSLDDLVAFLLKGMVFDFLDDHTPAFHCPCSEARVFRTLSLLPRTEVMDIIAKNDDIHAKCEFCGTTYTLAPDQILNHLNNIDEAKAAAAAS